MGDVVRNIICLLRASAPPREIIFAAVASLLTASNSVIAAESPLADAAENRNVAKIRQLLDERVQVDQAQVDGMTALHWAVHHEDASLAEQLVQAGANVNAVNRRAESEFFGITPLMMNALMTDDCAEATRLLLEAGADARVTYRGKSLVENAEEKGNAKILAVLRAAGG